MLITHRGLSGPAILQISSYWEKPHALEIDLAPGRTVTDVFCDPQVPRNTSALRSELRQNLPARFADRWLERHAPAAWTNAALALAAAMNRLVRVHRAFEWISQRLGIVYVLTALGRLVEPLTDRLHHPRTAGPVPGTP